MAAVVNGATGAVTGAGAGVLGTIFGNTIGIGSLAPVGLTIPLLTAGVGTFATPLAVLGVIKLGAALAIALGFIAVGAATGGSQQDDGYSSGGGGYGSSGGGGGYSSGGSSGGYPRNGYGRHRRQVQEAIPEIHAPSQEALFSLISAMDTYGCGKQLICELEAKNQASLAADELIMLRLFR